MFADQNLYLSSLLRFPETDELEYLHSITAGKTYKMQWNTQEFVGSGFLEQHHYPTLPCTPISVYISLCIFGVFSARLRYDMLGLLILLRCRAACL